MTGVPGISVVACDLGAGPIVHGRLAAWYRDGRDRRSLALDDPKGVWFDHGAQRGGGIIDLVMLALGCDRREAGAWLRRQYGLGGRPDPTLRARRQAAHEAAAGLAEWRWRVVQCLRALRNNIWDAWRDAERLYRGSNPTSDLPATEWRLLRQRLNLADQLDTYINHLPTLPASDLLALQRRVEGST